MLGQVGNGRIDNLIMATSRTKPAEQCLTTRGLPPLHEQTRGACQHRRLGQTQPRRSKRTRQVTAKGEQREKIEGIVIEHCIQEPWISGVQISGPSLRYLGTTNFSLRSRHAEDPTLQDRKAATAKGRAIEASTRMKQVKMGERENAFRANAIANHSIRENIAIKRTSVKRDEIVDLVEEGAEVGQLRCLIWLLTKQELMDVNNTLVTDAKGANEKG